MKDKGKTLKLAVVIILLTLMFGYKYSNKVHYICLKDNTYEKTRITSDMIEDCTFRGRTKKEYITSKEDIVNKCLKVNKRKKDLIYPSDIDICSDNETSLDTEK